MVTSKFSNAGEIEVIKAIKEKKNIHLAILLTNTQEKAESAGSKKAPCYQYPCLLPSEYELNPIRNRVSGKGKVNGERRGRKKKGKKGTRAEFLRNRFGALEGSHAR